MRLGGGEGALIGQGSRGGGLCLQGILGKSVSSRWAATRASRAFGNEARTGRVQSVVEQCRRERGCGPAGGMSSGIPAHGAGRCWL